MTEETRWNRVVSYYARPAGFSTGGVNTSRQQWMAALATSGLDVLVVSARDGFDRQLVAGERLSFESVRHLGRSRMTLIPTGLDRVLREGDLVYLHEGWTPSNLVASWICKRRGIDYVVLPHGVYASGITERIRLYGWRRRIENRVLRDALAVHLFFASEMDELCAISPMARSVVSVTGLDVPLERWMPEPEDPYIAWLGRYDIHHKGIDTLLAAMASLDPAIRPKLRMRGPDHLGDKQRVAAIIDDMHLKPWVDLGAELKPDDARKFLAHSRGFVHVPRWEAFGRTIVEAMSVGCPVVLSDAAHIADELDTAGAATVVAGSSIDHVAQGLTQLWEGSTITGPIGRSWVEENLAWPARAKDVLEQLNSISEPPPRMSQREREIRPR